MYAAEELQHWIQRASGVKIPIVKASKAPKNGTLLLVGASSISKKAGLQTPQKPEGLSISIFKRGVAILGEIAPKGTNNAEYDIDRGILHGVYEFLERIVGYRFYFYLNDDDPDFGTVIPRKKIIEIPLNFSLKIAPDFIHREGGFTGMWRYGDTKKGWQRSLRLGNSTKFVANHTDSQWGQKFYKKHPNWFMKMDDGTIDKVRLNYLQPGILKQRLEIIEGYYREGSWKGGWIRPNEKYIPFVPADNWSPTAANAKNIKALERKGDRRGKHSDIIFKHGVALAKSAKKRWPKKRVSMLAYEDFMFPPSIDIPDNLDVMVCFMLSGMLLKEPFVWEYNLKLIDNWRAKLKNKRQRLFVWDYPCWPKMWTSAPMIFPHVKQGWLKKMRSKISGEFLNSGGWNLPMSHYMNWIWHKLLWDSDADVDALLKEYCKGFFGPAAKPMERFYSILIERYENVKWNFKKNTSYVSPKNWYLKTYTEAVITSLQNELKTAMQKCSKSKKNLFRRRVLWMQEGFKGFFDEATLAHKWLREKLTYTSKKTARIPNKTIWKTVNSFELVQGNYGAKADYKTTIQTLFFKSELFIRFCAEEATSLLSKDKLIFIIQNKKPKQFVAFSVNAKGLSENNIDAKLLQNTHENGEWIVVVKIKLSNFDLKLNRILSQFKRIRESRERAKWSKKNKREKPAATEYIWMPQLQPPWGKTVIRWSQLFIKNR